MKAFIALFRTTRPEPLKGTPEMPGPNADPPPHFHQYEYDIEVADSDHFCVVCGEPNPNPVVRANTPEEQALMDRGQPISMQQVRSLIDDGVIPFPGKPPTQHIVVTEGIDATGGVGTPGGESAFATIEWKCRQVTDLDDGRRRYVFTRGEPDGMGQHDTMTMTTIGEPVPDFLTGRVYAFRANLDPVNVEEVKIADSVTEPATADDPKTGAYL